MNIKTLTVFLKINLKYSDKFSIFSEVIFATISMIKPLHLTRLTVQVHKGRVHKNICTQKLLYINVVPKLYTNVSVHNCLSPAKHACSDNLRMY